MTQEKPEQVNVPKPKPRENHDSIHLPGLAGNEAAAIALVHAVNDPEAFEEKLKEFTERRDAVTKAEGELERAQKKLSKWSEYLAASQKDHERREKRIANLEAKWARKEDSMEQREIEVRNRHRELDQLEARIKAMMTEATGELRKHKSPLLQSRDGIERAINLIETLEEKDNASHHG